MTTESRLQQLEHARNRLIDELVDKGTSRETASSFVEGNVQFTSDFDSGAVGMTKGGRRFGEDHLPALVDELHTQLERQAASAAEAAAEGKAAGEATKAQTAQQGLALK